MRRFQTVIVAAIAATIMLRAYSAILFGPGLPIFGDWVPVPSAFVPQVIGPWNPIQHNGMFTFDYRTFPWFGLLANVGGDATSLRFTIISRLAFVALSALPFLSMGLFLTWRRRLLSPVLVSGAALWFSLNPWMAAHVASGHQPLVAACALLPWFVPLAERGTFRSAVATGALLALVASFDVHTAPLAVIVIATAAQSSLPTRLRFLFTSAIASIALCAYWIVPTLSGSSGAFTAAGKAGYDLTAIRAVNAFGDPIHVLGMRSYWWIPFTRDLYEQTYLTQIIAAALLLTPTALLFLSIRDKLGRLGAFLFIIGITPSLLGHASPAVYSAMLRVPGAVLFRDPNKTMVLALLGVVLMLEAQTRVEKTKRWLVACAAATLVAAAFPWLTGDLRGNLRDKVVPSGQLAAINAIASAKPDARTLWLPAEPYEEVPWSIYPVGDPARFWSKSTVLNPVLDSAYDTSPDVSTAISALEDQLHAGLPDGILHVLQRSQIDFVGIRLDAQPSQNNKATILTLHKAGAHSQRYGSVLVFTIPSAHARGATFVSDLAVYDGTVDTLRLIGMAAPNDESPMISFHSAVQQRILHSTVHAHIYLRSIWDALFASGRLQSVGDNWEGREIYRSGNEYFRKFKPGERITLLTGDVSAIRVLGPNRAVSLSCDGGSAYPISYQQPDDRPRWLAVQCGITKATLKVHEDVWIAGQITMTHTTYVGGFALLADALKRINSAYILTPNDIIKLHTSAGTQIQSKPESPLLLPAGLWNVRVTCSHWCSTARVVFFTNDRKHSYLGRMTSKTNSRVQEFTVPGGMYGFAIKDIDPTDFLGIIVSRKRQSVTKQPAPRILGHVRLAGQRFLETPYSSVPWTIVRSVGVKEVPLRADLFGQVYMLFGQNDDLARGVEVTDNPLMRSVLLGLVVTTSALIFDISLMLHFLLRRIHVEPTIQGV